MIGGTKFPVFAIAMGIAGTIIYTVCELAGWTPFSYYPASGRLAWGTQLASKEEGPAMYWYGWTVAGLVGGAIVGIAATFLPENAAKRISPNLLWIVPIVAFVVLVYALRSFFLR